MIPLFFAFLVCAAAQAGREAASPPAPLVELARIPLGDVEGRIDHLALDEARAHLFVAARAQGALVVLDLAGKSVWKRIDGLREPQGLLYLPETDQLWVSEGGRDALDVHAGATLELVERLRLGPDADNLRCDARAGRVWLGYASGALAVLDARERKALGRVKLPAHPEAFALESAGARLFVDVPSERGVCVVDREKLQQIAFWPIESAQANYPLLLLEGEKHLFVGCRSPAKLVVLDSDAGKEVLALELSGDVDDLCLDEAHARIYAACGAGTLDVFERRAPANMWKRRAVLETASGARTALYSPARKQLFLAVPKSGERAAEIRVFEARD